MIVRRISSPPWAAMASSTLVLITGASRGFGRAVALALAASPALDASTSSFLLYASPRGAKDLERTAEDVRSVLQGRTTEEKGVGRVHPMSCDLSDVDQALPHMTSTWTTIVEWRRSRHAIFVNNAGSLGPLTPVHALSVADLRAAIDLNVTASLALSALFVRVTKEQGVPRCTVVNVSSVCAVQPIRSWGVYCAGKAARDLFHAVLALEEEPSHVKVLNYAPGPLDTDMQQTIRTSDPCEPQRQAFLMMKDEGKLLDPATSAHVLVELLEKDNYASGAHVDFYDC